MPIQLKQYRQGDVFIEQIAEIPKQAKAQRKSARIILAQGTATGNHHCMVSKSPVKWFKLGEISKAKAKGGVLGGEIFVTLPKGGKVVHQEHATIELPAGNYRAIRQREYSPEAIRNVAD